MARACCSESNQELLLLQLGVTGLRPVLESPRTKVQSSGLELLDAVTKASHGHDEEPAVGQRVESM